MDGHNIFRDVRTYLKTQEHLKARLSFPDNLPRVLRCIIGERCLSWISTTTMISTTTTTIIKLMMMMMTATSTTATMTFHLYYPRISL